MQQSDAMVQLTSALLHGVRSGYAGWYAEVNAAMGYHPNSPDAVAMWPTAENIKTADARVDESRHWLGLFDALLAESVRHHTAQQFAVQLEKWHKALTSNRRTMPGRLQGPSYATATLVAEIAHACLLLSDRYDDTMPGTTLADKRAGFIAYEASLTAERDTRRKDRKYWGVLPKKHSGKEKKRPTVPRIIQEMCRK